MHMHYLFYISSGFHNEWMKNNAHFATIRAYFGWQKVIMDREFGSIAITQRGGRKSVNNESAVKYLENQNTHIKTQCI